MALAQRFDLQEAGLVFPLRLARELIAPGNPERVFHRGVAGRRGLDMGMGQRLKRSSNFGRRGLPLLDQVARSAAQAVPARHGGLAHPRSALCANSIAFAWYWRNDFMAWNHGTPLPSRLLSGQTPSVLQQNQSVSKPGRSRISRLCVPRHCVLCHSER